REFAVYLQKNLVDSSGASGLNSKTCPSWVFLSSREWIWRAPHSRLFFPQYQPGVRDEIFLSNATCRVCCRRFVRAEPPDPSNCDGSSESSLRAFLRRHQGEAVAASS